MSDAASNAPAAVGLNPVQLRTLDALRRDGAPTVFDPAFVAELRDDARAALDALADRLAERPGKATDALGERSLYVTKHTLATVLACEAHHVAPDDFHWTPARARGQVAHKAIQLLLNWRGEPVPADLVDEAIARLADTESGLGDWLAGIDRADEADVRGRSVELVTKFLESFPPLDRRSHPMTEAAAQWPIDGPIVLRARVDLVIGRPSGRESRKVIVDLKSGRIVGRHREDLRFYALVETLCRDVPPRRLASFSLDAGRAVVEDVTEVLLRSALRRTFDAVERMVELTTGDRMPSTTPGVTCRWCALADACADGTAWLADAHRRDDDTPPPAGG